MKIPKKLFWESPKYWVPIAVFALFFLFFVSRVVLILISGSYEYTVFSSFLPGVKEVDTSHHGETFMEYKWDDNKPGRDYSIQSGYKWEALPELPPVPENNPMSAAKVALGKDLFNETLLSRDNSLSCLSCHGMTYEEAGTDKRSTAKGVENKLGNRNTPTVLNTGFQRLFFWDGRAKSLEEQALGPITNPIEMGMASIELAVQRLKESGRYRTRFALAFPEMPKITEQNLAKAIAAYERTLIQSNTPYDQFVRGDKKALSDKQIRGMALFEEMGCIHCHSGPNFSDASIYGASAGLRIFPVYGNDNYAKKYNLFEDLGKAEEVKGMETINNKQKGVFRIPSLRNVSRTAPYFHNGSVDTLEEAVKIMANVQLNKKISNSEYDDRMVTWNAKSKRLLTIRNIAISDQEVDEIVAFLEALTE